MCLKVLFGFRGFSPRVVLNPHLPKIAPAAKGWRIRVKCVPATIQSPEIKQRVRRKQKKTRKVHRVHIDLNYDTPTIVNSGVLESTPSNNNNKHQLPTRERRRTDFAFVCAETIFFFARPSPFVLFVETGFQLSCSAPARCCLNG